MPRIEVEITHPDRVLFPDPSSQKGITKRDLVDYYSEVADTMLPYLKARPLSVQRFPRGIGEPGFVQQDFADSLPDWMGRIEVTKESGTVVHPLAERREALQWLANQNCITLHAWQSRQGRLHSPDRLVFDLCTLWCRCAPTPISTPPGSSPATSPKWSQRTTPRTAPWKSARTSEATECISTSCETRTRRPPLRRIRSGPAPVPRWPLRWSGMNWTLAACGRIDSQSATFPNGWPGNAIRWRTCPGTPAH
jgi:hypothetical protein